MDYHPSIGFNHLIRTHNKEDRSNWYFNIGKRDFNENPWTGEEEYKLLGFPITIDLTLMFGAGNEPQTPEEFTAMFPNLSFSGHNAGELRHLSVEAIKTIGFNRLNLISREKTNFGENSLSPNIPKDFSEKYWYDGFSAVGRYDASKKYTIDYADDNSIKATFLTATPDTGGYGIGFPIRVLPNTTYTFKAKINVGKWNVMFATKDGLSLGYWELVDSSYKIPMPANCYWAIPVFIANDNSKKVDISDINISLTHSGYRDKEYEDYKEFTRELPVIKEYFPDGMKSAGNAYDELTSKKSVKRIKAVDLGSCDWYQVPHVSDSSKYQFWTISVLNITPGGNLISTDFFGRNNINEVADNPNGTGAFVTKDFALHVTNPKYNTMTATEFKEAVAGVVMLYETTKPETVVFDEPVNLDYEVCDFGTEEAVYDGNSAPFKADIVYGFNAVDTIRGNKIEIENLVTNALRKTSQVLTDAEKQQVQKNIGVDAVQQNINTEVQRAQAAESALQKGLASEVARAQGVEAEIKENVEGIFDALGYEPDITPAMGNGTQGNAGNANAVRTSSKIAGEVGKTYRIITDRPADEGCVYIYGYATYTSLDGALYQNYSRVVEYGAKSTINYVTLQEGEVGFSFVITQLNTATGEWAPLRTSSFSGYYIKIDVENLADAVNEEVRRATESDTIVVDIPLSVTEFSINTSGALMTGSSKGYCGLIPVTKGERYLFSGEATANLIGVAGYASDGNFVRKIIYNNTDAVVRGGVCNDLQFTIPNGIDYIACSTNNQSEYPLRLKRVYSAIELSQKPLFSEVAFNKRRGYNVSTTSGNTVADDNSEVSDYISVKAGDVVKYSGLTAGGRGIVCYDSEKKYLSALLDSSNRGGIHFIAKNAIDAMVVIPAGCSYIRASSNNYINNPLSIKIQGGCLNYGKKYVWFGDSLSALGSLPHQVGAKMGVDVVDVSFAGAPLTYSSTAYQATGFMGLVDCIVDSDYTAVENALAEQAANGTEITDKQINLNNLKTIDWLSVTNVVIMAGANDMTVAENTLDKIESGFSSALQKLCTKYPHLSIYVISSSWREVISNSANGLTLPDIIEKIKGVCESYHIPFFDFFNNCGVNIYNQSYFLSSDKKHPSLEGEALWSTKIANWLSSR